MFNKELLYDIRQVHTFLYGHYNYGVSKTNLVVNYGYIESCLGRYIIDNIFTMPFLVRPGCRITYDSDCRYYEVSKRDVYDIFTNMSKSFFTST